MNDSELLKSFVDQYQLEVDGLKFWTPYWREGEPLPATDHVAAATGPYKGKGSPRQLRSYIEAHMPSEALSDPDEWRHYLRSELHLGVECSGFIYYVLDQLLQTRHIDLAAHLFKSRADLLSDYARFGSPHRPEVTEDFLKQLPEQVSLARIHEFWGNQPVNLAGAVLMTNAASTRGFAAVSELRSADMIAMKGHDGIDHVLLVVSVEDGVITYAHSGGTHDRPGANGGVECGNIQIVAGISIADCRWLGNGQFIQESHNFNDAPLRRLRALDRD